MDAFTNVMALALALIPLAATDADGVVRHPLMELNGRHAAVFLFVGVDCPISNAYAPEINRVAADYAKQGFDFYRVYADPAVTAAAAKRHGTAYGYTCPALLDGDGAVVRRLGATRTPEVAVVAADGTVLYHGRIDDRYTDVGRQRYAATTHELRDALDDVIAGRAVKVPVTKAVGCPI